MVNAQKSIEDISKKEIHNRLSFLWFKYSLGDPSIDKADQRFSETSGAFIDIVTSSFLEKDITRHSILIQPLSSCKINTLYIV